MSAHQTIEIVSPQSISVALSTVEIGVSLNGSGSSPATVELFVNESPASIELSLAQIVVSNISADLLNPQFIYASGLLTRIDYDDGKYKVFTYSSGQLNQIDFYDGFKTIRKTLNRIDGVLTSITQTEL